MWMLTDMKVCTIIKIEKGLEKLQEKLYEIHLGNSEI